ncbi:MAG: O-antigen ligase family protein [Myxococcota bacterium]
MAAAGALALALVVSPLLLGGVPAWATVIIAGLATAALFATLFGLGPERLPTTRSATGVVIAASVLWTGLQALPLPCGVVEFLHPAAAREATTTAELLGTSAQCTLSRDPGATREALLRMCAIAAAFFAAFAIARRRRRLVHLAVASSVVVVTLVALGHQLVGAERVFGLYEPRFAASASLGPILNPNNLAGFLVLGIPLLIALALRIEDTRTRLALGSMAGLAIIVVFLTVSRGGIGALLLELTVLGAFVARRRGRLAINKGAFLAGVGFVALAIAAGGFVVADALAAEADNLDLRKIELAKYTYGFAWDNPWVGVGRGAFSATFPAALGVHRRWVHAESFPAEWAAEWGIPFALLFIGVLTFEARRAIRATQSTLGLAIGIGIGAFALQNLLDFGLELSGVAVVAFALLGALVAPAGDTPGGWPLPEARRLMVGTALASTALLLLLGLDVHRDAAPRLEAELGAHAEERDRGAFRETLERALEAHPEDPTFALLAGSEALYAGDPSALRWLNRAMVLAPGWAVPHVEAARWLIRAGRREQGMLELRAAAELHPHRITPVLCWTLRRWPDAELGMLAAPEEGDGRAIVLESIAGCLQGEEREKVDAVLLSEFPSRIEPQIRAASGAFEAGRREEAIASLQTLLEESRSDEVRLALGEFLLQSERADEAIRVVERSRSRAPKTLRLLARAQAASGNETAMRETLSRLKARVRLNRRQLAQAAAFEASLERELGNTGRAIRAYEAAFRYEENPRFLVGVAETAEHAGDEGRALRAYEQLVQAHPDNARYRQKKSRLETRIRTGRRRPRLE